MSIFQEVGMLIADENKTGQSGYNSSKQATSSYLPEEEFPMIDGDIIYDGEDILRVVTINRVISASPPSGKVKPEPVSENNDSEEITKRDADMEHDFWEPQIEEKPQKTKEPNVAETPTRSEEKVIRKEVPTPQNLEAGIVGDVIFPGNATISSDICGNISSSGVLRIYGTIKGNVEAEKVVLFGVIRGSLNCKELVLGGTTPMMVGRIEGSISAGSLSMEFSK